MGSNIASIKDHREVSHPVGNYNYVASLTKYIEDPNLSPVKSIHI